MDTQAKYIVFRLNSQTFAVNIKQISSIERYQPITKLPKTEEYIRGVINYRGETTPILDLKKRLNMADSEITKENRLLIAQFDNVQVGLLVDSATEVIDIANSNIHPVPEMIGQVTDTFISGIAKLEKRFLTLLDLEQILQVTEEVEVI